MGTTTQSALGCRNLTVTVPGRTLVEDLDMQVMSGEFLGVLGQNGAGKSLTLHTLAGLRSAEHGEVTLLGSNLASAKRQDVARNLALLPQYTEDVFPTTVLDTVLIGRHPHVGLLQWESAEDRRIAHDALQQMDLSDMPERDVGTLSGGERRRLAIAQTLTQTPSVYLLDEPTNHLDPQHQLDVLRIFQAQAASGATVVASLHDVNLAARYADKCLLLFGDGRWELGPTDSVLSEERLTELYGTPMEAFGWRDTRLFVAAGSSH
ncbi:MAG: ABC transporter ATP-binding protein [Woeseiaceae bacterium]